MNRKVDPASTGAISATESVRRRFAADARARAVSRAATTTIVATSAAVFLLEGAARLTFVAHLRPLELCCGLLALAAGLVDALRRLRREPAWRDRADRESPEPGVFSAAAHASELRSRFAALLSDRASRAAVRMLAEPRRPTAGRRRPLAVLRYAALAAIFALTPGKCAAPDALGADVAAALAREAEKLAVVARTENDPLRRAELESAAEALQAPSPRARDVRAAAEALRAMSKTETLDALRRAAGAAPALRPLAKAASEGNLRSVEAAKDALRKLIAEDAEVRAAVLAALQRNATAGAGLSGDPDLRTAAGQLASGDGNGAVDALGRAAERAATEAKAASTLRDVLVRLDAAAGPAGSDLAPESSAALATPLPTSPNGRSPGPASVAPPPDLGVYAAPGSVEETVLRRYFDPVGR